MVAISPKFFEEERNSERGEAKMKGIKKLTALYWAQINMNEAIALCDLAASLTKEQQTAYTIYGLLAGIGAAYSRSFTQSDGISSLDAKFTRFTSSELQQRHDWLIEMRNHQLAHKNRLWEQKMAADIGIKDEISKITVTVSKDGDTEWEVNRIHFPNVQFSRIKTLCEFQRARLIEESDRMLKHFLESPEVTAGIYDLERDFPDSS
jgi:hypothetical protein